MARLVELQSDAESSFVDIFFVDDPTKHDPSGWKRTFGDSAWFAETLPNRFPTARKYVFACQQQYISSSPVDVVQDAARSLLLQWAQLDINISGDTAIRRQRKTVHRPVLFVCQSLGGFVVQKALQLPESDGGNPALARRTFGTIFVGTPHPLASANHMETPISINESCATLRSQEAIWLSEQQIEGRLTLVGDAFRQAESVYRNIRFCLGTSSICPGANEVHQSCLWSTASQSQHCEREQNHYLLSESLDPITARHTVEHSIACMSDAATGSLQNFYQCLEGEESMKEMYANGRARGTCDWIFSLEKYNQWVSAKDSPLFWISGSPGMGKSTLCSAIIDDLRQHEQKGDRIAFSFLEDSWGRFDVAQYVLKTLTYQLLEHRQAESLGSFSLATARETEKISGPTLREDFQRQLRRILASVEEHARVFLVLDGLDCNEWIKEAVVVEIGKANLTRKSQTKFRCAIATHDLLEATLSHFPITYLNLDVEPGVRHDLQSFTTGGLADVAAKFATRRGSTTRLAARLKCRAKGVFLWAALALERLDRMKNPDDLAKAIDSIPSTVHGIYQEELRAIPSRNIDAVQRIFSWLTVAIRPLRLSELKEALAVDMDLSQLPAHRVRAVDRAETRNLQIDISRMCGSLVTTTETGVVRLRHPSLRTYLLFTERSSGPPRSPILEAHGVIARTCLVLLNPSAKKNASIFGIRFSSLGTAKALSSLIDYAAANWLLHYRLAETHSRVLAGILHGCLSETLNHACEYLNLSSSGRSVQIANTTLRISAAQGLVSLIRMCLEMGTDPEASSCNRCETPLALAAAGGHVEATDVLLKRAVSSVPHMPYDIGEMLYHAVASGLTDIAKTLLRYGAKVDFVDHDSGRTLLHNAAASGDWELVGLLMDYNADVNAVDPTTLETPLHLGALHGHLQVVRYLVDGRNTSAKEVATYDSIVQQPYYQSWTDELLSEDEKAGALIWEVGARDSAEDHLEKLLSWSRRYANVNMRTVGALTALDLAASNGHENVVRFLLERGATLQKAKSAPCTALQAAVENGHMATVKLLLAAGADILQKFEKLGATLKHASKKGHDDVADLLVWHYFNAEISGNESFQWPILCVPTKSRHTVVRDSIQKTEGNKSRTKRNPQSRSFPRVSTTLTERPKY